MLPLLAVAVVVALWFFTRTGVIFVVSVRNGVVLLVRGRIPPALLADFAEVVRRPPIRRGSIRGLKTEHGGRLSFSGIDEGREQRMRNIFALYPASKLRHAPAIKRPTLGQLSGIAWLAWFFDRR